MIRRSSFRVMLSLAAMGSLACSKDSTPVDSLAPQGRTGPITPGMFAVKRTEKSFATGRFAMTKTPYSCSVVSKHPDGLYRHANVWLRMPQALVAPGNATQIYRLEWRPSPGAPMAAANCRIPTTPSAEKFLLERVFYIDPKTMRNGEPAGIPPAENNGLFAPRLNSGVACCVRVIVIGNAAYWLSGSGSRSNPGYTPTSVPSWSGGDPGYFLPGDPCGDGYNFDIGVGVNPVESFLKVSTDVVCPVTVYESICFDFYIPDCVLNVVGAGDCRTADAYARPALSRAQLVIPVSSALQDLAKVYMSPTCFRGEAYCRKPLGSEHNQVFIGYTGDTIALWASLTNSLTYGPAINAAAVIVRGADGTITIPAAMRNDYPSLTVVHSKNGVNTVLVQRDANRFLALFDNMHLTDFFALCVPQN